MNNTVTRPEVLAWRKLREPAARGRYEHVRAWNKRNRRRASFADRLRLADGGCWVWQGQTSTRAGRSYALVSHREQPGNRRIQSSAFVWMVGEFFPESAAITRHRTSPRCGVDLCINPWHREDRRVTRQTVTASQAREIYAAKGIDAATDVADRYGISRDQVLSIWRGRSWSQETGASKHIPTRRVTPPDVLQAILDRKGTGSSRAVAADIGIGHSVVRRVWAEDAVRLSA